MATKLKLTIELTLYVDQAGSDVLLAHSSTFDNSFEIVEFEA